MRFRKAKQVQQAKPETKSDKAVKGLKGTFYAVKTLWTVGLLVLGGVLVWAIVSAISAIGTELTAIFG